MILWNGVFLVEAWEAAPKPKASKLPGPTPAEDEEFAWGIIVNPGNVQNTKPGSKVFFAVKNSVPITLNGDPYLLVDSESLLLTMQ